VSEDKIKGSVKLYRKDPCPINYQQILSEGMSYIFYGWLFWLIASVIDKMVNNNGWIQI
tara:strand:- start:307 stop:483 length:177 start_codon:yes stop_codon:yes gene_type:complete